MSRVIHQQSGEPGNPYEAWSGCWHSYNKAYRHKQLLNGPGWLYAIRRKSDSAIKLGISSKPSARLSAIRGYSPFSRHGKDEFSMLFRVRVQDMLASERLVHRQMEAFRIEGEWFALDSHQAREVLEQFGPVPYQIAEYRNKNAPATWVTNKGDAA